MCLERPVGPEVPNGRRETACASPIRCGGESRYRAPMSEADGEANRDTAIGSCRIDSHPGASANCTTEGGTAQDVRHRARAALLLVAVTQNRGEGAECDSTDHGAYNRAVSERIS